MKMKTLVATLVLGCGFFLQAAPAGAATIVVNLLRENFNDIQLANPGDTIRLDQIDPLSGWLPAGIEFQGITNVRRADDALNLEHSDAGFHEHFTSNFLVLGDEIGLIGDEQNAVNSIVRIPFTIPTNAIRIFISYRDAFNGFDAANLNRVDEFLVRVNGPGETQPVELLLSPFDFGGHGGLAADFDVFDDNDPSTLSPGTYNLVFRLNESGGATDTAAGLDRIRVRAEVVPAPGTLALLGLGMAGLAVRRSRRAA